MKRGYIAADADSDPETDPQLLTSVSEGICPPSKSLLEPDKLTNLMHRIEKLMQYTNDLKHASASTNTSTIAHPDNFLSAPNQLSAFAPSETIKSLTTANTNDVKASNNNESQASESGKDKKLVIPMMKGRTKKERPHAKTLKRKETIQNVGSAKRKDGISQHIAVYFGHENWNLVMNMMIGIRTAVKNVYQGEHVEITQNDFTLKCEYSLIQKRTDNFDLRKTCLFFDYFPNIFYQIRKCYNISNEQYLRSIGPEQLLVTN